MKISVKQITYFLILGISFVIILIGIFKKDKVITRLGLGFLLSAAAAGGDLGDIELKMDADEITEVQN